MAAPMVRRAFDIFYHVNINPSCNSMRLSDIARMRTVCNRTSLGVIWNHRTREFRIGITSKTAKETNDDTVFDDSCKQPDNRAVNDKTVSNEVQKINNMRRAIRERFQLDKKIESGGVTWFTNENQDTTKSNQDFFGILEKEDENHESVVIQEQDVPSPMETVEETKETVIQATFGTVRLDSPPLQAARKVKRSSLRANKHKMLDPANNDDHQTTDQNGIKFLDTQYLGPLVNSKVVELENEPYSKAYVETKMKNNEAKKISMNIEDDKADNIFDEQYFYDQSKDQEVNEPESAGLENNDIKPPASVGTDPSNIFDEQYFYPSADNNGSTSLNLDHTSQLHENRKSDSKLQSYDVSEATNLVSTKEDLVVGGMTNLEKKSRKRVKANIEEPKTAYDLAVKIRLDLKGLVHNEEEVNEKLAKSVFEKSSNQTEESNIDNNHPLTKKSAPSRKYVGSLDSQGFRNLKNQVSDIHSLPDDIVVQILKDSILYEDDELVAIDKPYGLPSHGGPGMHHSIGKLLPDLTCKLNNVDALHLVHRLDKETTGVMLLAKNAQVANILHGKFLRREIVKKYWVLTKGVPNPSQGVIDIPLTETQINGKYRMKLSPNYSPQMKILFKKPRNRFKYEATTVYKVLDRESSCALVECQPLSGIKHQIRCHLAFGLNTPILGDHKYSHSTKIAPQKLPPQMLQRLGIRQQRVRDLPMHLHASSLVIPEYRNGQNIHIMCRLPKHFLQNMKWLKLRTPKRR